MRHFNTTGPMRKDDHYCIDPLSRWKLDDVLSLIEQKKYFILHAPRQTGKTSSLLTLRDKLNAEGKYFAVYINVEAAQIAGDNVDEAMNTIVSELLDRVIKLDVKGINFFETLEYSSKVSGQNRLNHMLGFLSRQINKNIVLFIDEIDALQGRSLISVFRQLRAGYDDRLAGYRNNRAGRRFGSQ